MKKIKSRSIPRFDSRTVFEQGSAVAITIHEDWLKQHHLSEGDEVYAFLDKEKERFILVAGDNMSEHLVKDAEEKGFPEETRKITKQGKGYGIYIPKDWVKELKIGNGEELLVRSNNAMSFDVFTPERKEEYHELLEVEI